MKIRQVKKEDLAAICNIELLTFPPQEAASYETFLYRHIHFPQYFFLAESGDGAIAAFLSGRPVDIADDAGSTIKCTKIRFFRRATPSLFCR